MFISKRKWDEICERIDELNSENYELNETLKQYYIILSQLADLHNYEEAIKKEKYSIVTMPKSKNRVPFLDRNVLYHSQTTEKSSTKEISNITLEELARLVIDGTPITRKVMEENIKEYGRME